MHRHLERRESAVARPPHPDPPVGPRLGREPLDRVVAVELLDGPVLVGVDAVGPAGAAHVEAHADEPALGEVAVYVGAAARDVVLTVRVVLDNSGEPDVALGADQVGREQGPVARGNADVALLPDAVARIEGHGSTQKA